MKLNKGYSIDSLELPSTSGGTFNIKDIAGKKNTTRHLRFLQMKTLSILKGMI
jgi:hypothetical protein